MFGLSCPSCFLGRRVLTYSQAAALQDDTSRALKGASVLSRAPAGSWLVILVLFLASRQLVREEKFCFIFFSFHRCWLISSQTNSICFCSQTGSNLRVGCSPEPPSQTMNFGDGWVGRGRGYRLRRFFLTGSSTAGRFPIPREGFYLLEYMKMIMISFEMPFEVSDSAVESRRIGLRGNVGPRSVSVCTRGNLWSKVLFCRCKVC